MNTADSASKWFVASDNAAACCAEPEELPEHTYQVISRVFPNGLMAVSR